jgi:hypothetical protein
MQIEDGGDSPEVNEHLLAALRAAVIHQVGEAGATPVLRALEAFRRSEAERWKQIQAGVPPPLEPEEQLDDLVEQGYAALERKKTRTACDHWLAAWEIVRQLAQPDLRTASAFSAHFELGAFLENWTQELIFELRNVGRDDPRCHEQRLQFAREFLAQFPDEDDNTQVNFMRAQGEALWAMGRQSDAEAVYTGLVQRFPDEAWSYIGWADHYWLWTSGKKEYTRAEAIMTRALARPQLRDRSYVLDRLRELYTESGQRDKLAQLEKEATAGSERGRVLPFVSTAGSPPPARHAPKPGRNDPCWCGSGKKYKRCHLQSDQG